MQRWHISTNSMKKLFFSTFLFSSILFGGQIKINTDAQKVFNNIMMVKLKNIYPKLYTKVQELKRNNEEIEKTSHNDVVYLFTSSSVPLNVFKKFIIEGSVLNEEYGVKVVLVLQGFNNKKYIEYMRELDDFFDTFKDGEIFKKNILTMYDPFVFKNLNIKQVPVLAIASYKESFYPSKSDIKYVLRGNRTLGYFFDLLKKDDEKYEKYFNSISDIY